MIMFLQGENMSTLNMNKHIVMKQLGNGPLCRRSKKMIITKTKQYRVVCTTFRLTSKGKRK